MGAFTFRRQVYAEVERDTTFTMTAWLLVAVVAFLNQLGTHASTKVLEWLGSTVVGTIWAVIAFAVAAYIMNWMGRALFQADVTFEELVRTLGLAYKVSASKGSIRSSRYARPTTPDYDPGRSKAA